jgi:hypothetical protein
MTEPRKPRDANATIQIDLSQVQLYDPNVPPPGGAAYPGGRSVPPPLPGAPLLPTATEPAPRSPAKVIAYVAMFVVLLGCAITGGLMVGRRARGPGSPAPSAAAAGLPAPTTSSSQGTLTLPTIEMR